jgi:hypothetical protein
MAINHGVEGCNDDTRHTGAEGEAGTDAAGWARASSGGRAPSIGTVNPVARGVFIKLAPALSLASRKTDSEERMMSLRRRVGHGSHVGAPRAMGTARIGLRWLCLPTCPPGCPSFQFSVTPRLATGTGWPPFVFYRRTIE